jgi:hypothetical protein
MATKSGNYIYNDDGSVSTQVGGNVGLDSSNAIIPIDIQSRLASTIQTHNAVSVGASAESLGTWIPCDGFDKVSVTMKNDAGTASFITLQWSSDGSSVCGEDVQIINNSNPFKAIETGTKASYLRVRLYNSDTIAHTMSAWIYLKC